MDRQNRLALAGSGQLKESLIFTFTGSAFTYMNDLNIWRVS